MALLTTYCCDWLRWFLWFLFYDTHLKIPVFDVISLVSNVEVFMCQTELLNLAFYTLCKAPNQC